MGGGLGVGHGRAHRYAVVGPEKRGHGCEAHGGKGWEVGAPRVGQWWDVNSGGGGGM